MLTSLTVAETIGASSLEFQTKHIKCISLGGSPYLRTVRYGLPRVPPRLLSCCVFLYASRDDAEKGENSKGTGFIVGVQSEDATRSFAYVVSCKHVVYNSYGSMVRLPLTTPINGAKFDIFEFDCLNWSFHPDYDIAVIPIPVKSGVHFFSAMPTQNFLTKENKSIQKIGLGDDTFMVGQFMEHNANGLPVARFGHIGMDLSPVFQSAANTFTDAYCLDMNSRSGFSGSPVFVYRTPGYDLEEELGEFPNVSFLVSGRNHFSLLGMHIGQFPEKLKIKNGSGLILDYVEALSGMTVVVPSWSILEVLNMPELVEHRREANACLDRRITAPLEESNDTSIESNKGDAVLGRMLTTAPKPRE